MRLVRAFEGKTSAGALAIGPTSTAPCVAVMGRVSEGIKFVALANHPPKDLVLPDGVKTKFIFASDIKDNEVSRAVHVDFLPKALAAGTYICAPEPGGCREGT